MKRYLVTGAAGYIGSHFLQKAILDSRYNGSEFVCIDKSSEPEWIMQIFREHPSRLTYVRSDLIHVGGWGDKLKDLSGVFHFAGLKDVAESFEKPLEYYRDNVFALLELLNGIDFSCTEFFCFSSSASVYGNSVSNEPVSETHDLNPLSPYARSKIMAEEIINDFARSTYNTKFISLRYFNPVGGSKEIQTPFQSSLFDQICLNLKNGLPIRIFGNDYETDDGTCVRDYIDIDDLMDAHLLLGVADLSPLEQALTVFNVGSSRVSSVAEVVNQMSELSGRKLATTLCGKRVGDIPFSAADGGKLKSFLNWSPNRDLRTMCKHHLNWRS